MHGGVYNKIKDVYPSQVDRNQGQIEFYNFIKHAHKKFIIYIHLFKYSTPNNIIKYLEGNESENSVSEI